MEDKSFLDILFLPKSSCGKSSYTDPIENVDGKISCLKSAKQVEVFCGDKTQLT